MYNLISLLAKRREMAVQTPTRRDMLMYMLGQKRSEKKLSVPEQREKIFLFS